MLDTYQMLALSEYKADDASGIFEGYASTYNLDLVGDRIMPGAFGKTIVDRKGKVPILRNHDMNDWVGHTLSLAEDERGLKVQAKLFLDTTGGRDTHNLIKSLLDIGVRPGLSIGFNTVLSEWEGNTRLIKEIDLWETSLTAFPAQPRAYVEQVKTVRDLEQVLHINGFSRNDARRIVAIVKSSGMVSGGMPGAVIARNQRAFEALRSIR